MMGRTVNERFFDLWAGFYDYGPFSRWLRSVQEDVIARMDIQKNSRILDIGCGTGYGLRLLTGQGHDLMGIDLSEKMLMQARKNLTGCIDVTLIQADVDAMPINDASVDYVLSTEAFHHYPDQPHALQEMYRVLKPGGTLTIADIEISSKILHWFFSKIEPGCNRLNTKQEMKILIERQGFVIDAQKRIRACAVATYAHKPPHQKTFIKQHTW